MKRTYQKPILEQMALYEDQILCFSNFSNDGGANTNITPGNEEFGGIFKSNEESSEINIWE